MRICGLLPPGRLGPMRKCSEPNSETIKVKTPSACLGMLTQLVPAL